MYITFLPKLNLKHMFPARKVPKYGVFSVPYFPVFGQNMERNGVSLSIQSKCAKILTRKKSVVGHFSRSGYFS